MTRNEVAPEQAAINRTTPGGRYTFNAFTPEDYAGVAFVFAVIRLGDHAHVEVESGRAIPQPERGSPRYSTGVAGRLCLRWHEWEKLRAILDAHPEFRIAEVEQPTDGQVERYTAPLHGRAD